MIKIFHCADLHLDSPFTGCDLRKSEASRKRLRAVFSKMMSHIRETGYDLVLMAGDIYDSGFVTDETAELFEKELALLPCPVVIAPGNHDPYVKGSIYACRHFPDNVKIFTQETLSRFDFDRLGVSVYGYAFCDNVLRKNPLVGVKTLSDGRINILLAHTEIGAPLSPYAPISYADLDAAGFDYAALGHIHNAKKEHRGNRCVSAYSGFAEGRAFDELGFGGALSVSIFETGEKVDISVSKIQFASHRYEEETLDVTGAFEDAQVRGKLCELIERKEYGKETSLRVILCGEVDIGYTPSVSALTYDCASPLDFLEIRDKTLPIFDGKYLEKDISLKGELYRTLKEKMISAESGGASATLAATALRIGLAALEGRDIFPEISVSELESSEEEGEEDF